jgi:hypothetical protein
MFAILPFVNSLSLLCLFIIYLFIYLGVLNNSDATSLGAANLASNFKINIDLNPEIISPQPEMLLIYNQKYINWLRKNI